MSNITKRLVKLTYIQASFVADAWQRSLSAYSAHRTSHNASSFFHRSIILSVSLSGIFLSDIVQRTIVNNLYYKKRNKRTIHTNKFT